MPLYTRLYISLLCGELGILNFGGILVNRTEGYFQENGYSFSMPANHRARLHISLNDYTIVCIQFLFGVLAIYNFGGVIVNRTEGYFQVNGYAFFAPANCRAGVNTHLKDYTKACINFILFGVCTWYL